MIRKILVAFACVSCFYIYIRYLEKSSLYYPLRQLEGTPTEIGLPYENVFFNASDNTKLHGWFVPATDAKATVIFVHGNGGNISHRLDKIRVFNELNVNLFIFDYRGYGRSKGVSGEQGLYLDIQAAYDYIRRKDSTGKVIIYGESLGGSLAVDLASKADIDGLILEGAFTSVADMAKIVYPWLPAVLLKTKFDTISKISHVKAPKLHFHAEFDDVVPLSMGSRLFKAAKEPKKFVLLEGMHNDSFFVSAVKVRSELKEFFSSL
ncbi:MAG: alpha/beta hydrolase [Candidatus Omnitrophica bacterium]|nr:alpha/beta hydrolase [Candidatus Omnitrophota bacterium]